MIKLHRKYLTELPAADRRSSEFYLIRLSSEAEAVFPDDYGCLIPREAVLFDAANPEIVYVMPFFKDSDGRKKFLFEKIEKIPDIKFKRYRITETEFGKLYGFGNAIAATNTEQVISVPGLQIQVIITPSL